MPDQRNSGGTDDSNGGPSPHEKHTGQGRRGAQGSSSRPAPSRLSDPHRILVWDLDGTIADTRADIATGVIEMLRELGRTPLDLAQVIRNVGRGVNVLVAGCLADAGKPARDAAEIEHGVQVFRAHYWRHLMDTTAPYPGMLEILRDMSARGRSMAIVSNKPQDATIEILRRMEILDCFAAVLGGDSLPTRKPDPAPLLHALRLCLAGAQDARRLENSPCEQASGHTTAATNSLPEIASRRAAMIGDSLPDVQAARAAGMPICGVAWGFDPDAEMRRVKLDWWFESVEELGKALRE